MLLLIDNYDSFTYNLAHLFGELGRGGGRAAQRRDHGRRRPRRLAPSHARHLARARAGPRTPASPRTIVRAFAGRVPMLGVCLGHQAIVDGVRRRGRPGAGARARQGDDASRHDGRGHLRRPAGRRSRPAATTRSRRPSVPDCLEVSATRSRRRGDGRAPPRAAGRRRAVPPGVGADAGRAASSARNFLERPRDPGRRSRSCSTATTSRARRRAA